MLVSRPPLSKIQRYIFRTYGTSARGVEAPGSNWTFLDLTPLDRQEEWQDRPRATRRARRYEWWRRHDEYEAKP